MKSEESLKSLKKVHSFSTDKFMRHLVLLLFKQLFLLTKMLQGNKFLFVALDKTLLWLVISMDTEN
jgi:membrane protein required for beta-lactamase induction